MEVSVVLKGALLVLTDTRQPPVIMGLKVKTIFSDGRPPREVWTALIDRGVADTSWNRNQHNDDEYFQIISCSNILSFHTSQQHFYTNRKSGFLPYTDIPHRWSEG